MHKAKFSGAPAAATDALRRHVRARAKAVSASCAAVVGVVDEVAHRDKAAVGLLLDDPEAIDARLAARIEALRRRVRARAAAVSASCAAVVGVVDEVAHRAKAAVGLLLDDPEAIDARRAARIDALRRRVREEPCVGRVHKSAADCNKRFRAADGGLGAHVPLTEEIFAPFPLVAPRHHLHQFAVDTPRGRRGARASHVDPLVFHLVKDAHHATDFIRARSELRTEVHGAEVSS